MCHGSPPPFLPSRTLWKPGIDILLGHVAGGLERLHQVVALGVHVGGNVVRHLAGRVAEAHALVERGRAHPHRPPVAVELLRLPEPHMVPLARVGPDRHLEREVLLAAVVVQAAHRRIVVRPLEHRRFGNLQATLERERVGRIPLRGDHDPLQLPLGADDGHVERIAGDARRRVRDAGNVFERRMAIGVRVPKQRRHHVGQGEVNRHENAERDKQRAAANCAAACW